MEHVDPELFAELVLQFAQLAATFGEPVENGQQVRAAIRAALDSYQDSPEMITRVQLALAAYHTTLGIETDERGRALTEAVAVSAGFPALNTQARLSALSYLVDISRYDQALDGLRDLDASIAGDETLGCFRIGILTLQGVALFTSFRDLEEAERCLERAAHLAAAAADPATAKWHGTSLHYLGRIAEVRRRPHTSMTWYLAGQRIQSEDRNDLVAEGFFYLRIAELLIGENLFDQAADHLRWSAQALRLGSNQSSAILQTEVGYATLAAAQGDYGYAAQILGQARTRARTIGFWRGELLILGYWLALEWRRRRMLAALRVAGAIVQTVPRGEFARNGIGRLLPRIPLVLPVAIRRMRTSRRRPGSPEAIRSCECPRHSASDVTGE
jgi:hypothetical protein